MVGVMMLAALVGSASGVTVHLGFMAPYSVDCPACLATAVAAAMRINATTPHSVVLHARDSTNLTGTLEGAIDLCEHVGVDAVVADLYSSRVTLSARIAEIYTVPMVGYGSTSDALSDKTQYPMFSRVVSPDVYQATALVAAIQSFGWERIGLLYADESYGTNYATQLAAAADAAGLIIHIQRTFRHTAPASEIELPVSQIAATPVRVIVLVAISTDVTNAVLAAQAQGITGGEYVWIGTDGTITAELFTGANAAAGAAVNGMLGIFPQYDPASTQAQLAYTAVVTSPSWPPGYAHIPTITDPYNPWAYYVWDAVIHTVNAVIDARTAACTVGACTQTYIRLEETVSGATGTIRMDANGDRPGSYSMVNLRTTDPNVFVPVGTISVNGSDVDVQIDQGLVLFASGTSDIPDDGDFSVKTDEGDDVVAAVVSVVVVMLVIMAVWFIWYRRKMRGKLLDSRARLAAFGEFLEVKTPYKAPAGSNSGVQDNHPVWLWKEPYEQLRAGTEQHDAEGWAAYKSGVTRMLEEEWVALVALVAIASLWV